MAIPLSDYENIFNRPGRVRIGDDGFPDDELIVEVECDRCERTFLRDLPRQTREIVICPVCIEKIADETIASFG